MYLYTSITKFAMVSCLNTCLRYYGSYLSLLPSSHIIFSNELSGFFFSILSKNLEGTIAKADLVLNETAIKARKDLVTVMSVSSFSASTQSRQIC